MRTMPLTTFDDCGCSVISMRSTILMSLNYVCYRDFLIHSIYYPLSKRELRKLRRLRKTLYKQSRKSCILSSLTHFHPNNFDAIILDNRLHNSLFLVWASFVIFYHWPIHSQDLCIHGRDYWNWGRRRYQFQRHRASTSSDLYLEMNCNQADRPGVLYYCKITITPFLPPSSGLPQPLLHKLFEPIRIPQIRLRNHSHHIHNPLVLILK